MLAMALYVFGSLQFIDFKLADIRFQLLSREATGDLVIVEIDAASLRELNVWPWPRSYHATLLDKLLDSGARRVGFDIDFSSHSSDREDRIFAHALESSDGRTILPTFFQLSAQHSGTGGPIRSLPLPAFSRHAQLASVNIFPREDGLIRDVSSAVSLGDTILDSMFALLAGVQDTTLRPFHIDYGIRQNTIPRVSYADFLLGRIDPAVVAGKDVLIGATALELGDLVHVPVSGIFPGSVVLALAYESLVQGRNLRTVAPEMILIVLLLFAALFGPQFRRLAWHHSLTMFCGIWAVVLGCGLMLQAYTPFVLDASPWLVGSLGSYGVSLLSRSAAMFEDIKTSKLREMEISRAKSAAESENLAKSAFLANMSHELRTPLNAIIGYSEMMLEDAQEEGAEERAADLQKVRSSGQHLLALISDILDISKIESDKLELSYELEELDSLISEVENTIAPSIAKNCNRLELDLPASLGLYNCDAMRVRQILLNLLSNAAKFTNEGVVGLSAVRLDDGSVRFEVSDSGIGMTAKQLETLFQPFQQADISITQRFGGTGLGLVISQRFVEMMGGTIEVESELGSGTRFTVWLPDTPPAVHGTNEQEDTELPNQHALAAS